MPKASNLILLSMLAYADPDVRAQTHRPSRLQASSAVTSTSSPPTPRGSTLTLPQPAPPTSHTIAPNTFFLQAD